MAEYLVQEETLTDIADAIREQTGDENPIMLSNFASEIASIQGGGNVNYSTTEHEIGTWIDGKTLYEKTVVFQNFSAGDKYIDIVNADTAFIYGGFFKQTSGGDASFIFGAPLYNTGTFGAYGYIASICDSNHDNKLTVSTYKGTWDGDLYLTIRYTKQSAQEVSP